MRTRMIGLAFLLAGAGLALFLLPSFQGRALGDRQGTALGPQAIAVGITDFAFTPQLVTVARGDQITWTNRGALAHNVTADLSNLVAGGPRSGDAYPEGIPAGSTYQWTVPFDAAPGTVWYYTCTFHGKPGDGHSVGTGMAGSVVVK